MEGEEQDGIRDLVSLSLGLGGEGLWHDSRINQLIYTLTIYTFIYHTLIHLVKILIKNPGSLRASILTSQIITVELTFYTLLIFL